MFNLMLLEVPGIPDSHELFLILVAYYGIMDTLEKFSNKQNLMREKLVQDR